MVSAVSLEAWASSAPAMSQFGLVDVIHLRNPYTGATVLQCLQAIRVWSQRVAEEKTDLGKAEPRGEMDCHHGRHVGWSAKTFR